MMGSSGEQSTRMCQDWRWCARPISSRQGTSRLQQIVCIGCVIMRPVITGQYISLSNAYCTHAEVRIAVFSCRRRLVPRVGMVSGSTITGIGHQILPPYVLVTRSRNCQQSSPSWHTFETTSVPICLIHRSLMENLRRKSVCMFLFVHSDSGSHK